MIAAQEKYPRLTPEEYFIWEEKQLEKHEYIDGRLYAMGGGSVNHGRLAIRLTTLFETHLANSSCIVGNSDIKIQIVDTNNYTYPDASVTCDGRDKTTPLSFAYPCLIVEVLEKLSLSPRVAGAQTQLLNKSVEVLSDSTEAYDRGGKFRMYCQNPVLQDYLLVSSTKIEVDLYHKNDAGEWVIVHYKAGDTIALNSIHLSFPIEQLYRDLVLTPVESA